MTNYMNWKLNPQYMRVVQSMIPPYALGREYGAYEGVTAPANTRMIPMNQLMPPDPAAKTVKTPTATMNGKTGRLMGVNPGIRGMR